MISIFNGQRRQLGKTEKQVYIQVSVEMRDHLHILKGPKLAVFMAISLHIDAEGWSFPSISKIIRDTGYKRDAVHLALDELRRIEIDGQRLLLTVQPRGERGVFSSNRYLIFPTKEEVRRYEKRAKKKASPSAV